MKLPSRIKLTEILNRSVVLPKEILLSNMVVVLLLLFISDNFQSSSVICSALVLAILITYIFRQHYLQTAWFWALMTVIVGIDICIDPYTKANHDYLLGYICFILAIGFFYSEQFEQILKRNSRLLIALIMVFAVYQKLASTEFKDGSYISYMTLRGSFFKPVQFIPTVGESIKHNINTINEILNGPPGKILYFNSAIKDVSAWSKYFSLLIILSEIIIPLLILINYSKLLDYYLLIFLTILLFTRQECGFICSIIILCLAQLNSSEVKLAKYYFVLFVLSACLVPFGLGYA